MFFENDTEIKYRELKVKTRAIVDFRDTSSSLSKMKREIEESFLNRKITTDQKEDLLNDLKEYEAFVFFMLRH